MLTVDKLNKGEKVWFAEEKQGYTVRAANDRYAVCTKPFNPRKTLLYSIVDLIDNIRGRENLIFCMGFESDQDCEKALQRLASGETEVSHRHHIELNIIKIQQSKNK